MGKKRKTETGKIRVTISGSGELDMTSYIDEVVSTLFGNHHLATNVEYVERDGIDVEMRFKFVNGVYDDNGAPVYEEPEKLDNVVDMEQARGKAEKPADDCNCPACQLRRMLMWGLDPSKPGSDRTAIQIFEITPNGIRPIK